MTTLAPATVVSPAEPAKPKLAKAGPPKYSKDPKKGNWKDNYANPLLSGIVFKDDTTEEVVHFTAIQHREIQKEPGLAFRVTVYVDKSRKPNSLPRKQTFEEMIQAKRRQQNLLYASHHSNTSSTVLSERAARRVSAAARRRATAHPTVRPSSHRPVQEEASTLHPSDGGPSCTSSTSKRPRASKRKRPPRSSPSKRATIVKPNITTTAAAANPIKLEPRTHDRPSTSAEAPAPLITPSLLSIPPGMVSSPDFGVKTTCNLMDDNNALHMISSMKELSRLNPSLGTIDKKEIKRLLKSAPPGSALVLSNGTVIKKSRRGGARAGAGRKRNRPACVQDWLNRDKTERLQSDSSSKSVTSTNPKSNQPAPAADLNSTVRPTSNTTSV